MHGFLEARRLWEPGIRLATGDLSPFRFWPKVSGVNVHWANANHTFFAHKNPQSDTFLCDISPAKLRSTAREGIPKRFSNLGIRLIVAYPMTASLHFAQGNSEGLPC